MATTTTAQRDIKWIDGLRGIASFLVVTAHCIRSVAPHYIRPAMEEYGEILLFQRPFLRMLVMGRSSIAIFAVLTGHVAAMKPIKLARAGSTDAALSIISRTAFRRIGRFVFPSVIATTISWLLCELGAYKIAQYVQSDWIRDSSPPPSSSFTGAVFGLVKNLVTNWTEGANVYDPTQWTLTFLLRGSMLIYLTLFATIYVKPKSRMLIYGGLYIYMLLSHDAIGMNVFTGVLLAEMSFEPSVQEYAAHHSKFRWAVTSLMTVLGLLFCSYPEADEDWVKWSRTLHQIGDAIFPWGTEMARVYPAIGADLLLTSVFFSPVAQKALSSPVLVWLGRLSWPVYLIHNVLIRTVLTWMLYGVTMPVQPEGKDPEGNDWPISYLPIAGLWIQVFAYPLFYCFLYRMAQLWLTHVDPLCAGATLWFEDRMFVDDANTEKALLS